MSDDRPRVSIINSNDEIVLALRELLDEAGFSASTGHVFDFKTGRASILKFLDQWDPQAIVYDVAPPYETNWHFLQGILGLEAMKGRALVITTTNKKQLRAIAGSAVDASIEILGKPEDMGDIVDAVRRTLAKRRAA